jgi:hypothetical protein
MKKVILDGEVAVLVSPGFGAGWSTWNYQYPEMLFDPKIVAMVETEQSDEAIVEYCKVKYPEGYFGGVDDLQIVWLPVGTHFRIQEYDGSESLEIREYMHWQVA